MTNSNNVLILQTTAIFVGPLDKVVSILLLGVYQIDINIKSTRHSRQLDSHHSIVTLGLASPELVERADLNSQQVIVNLSRINGEDRFEEMMPGINAVLETSFEGLNRLTKSES